MAYLKTVFTTCDHPGCMKEARVELFNRRNALSGRYCRVHGDSRLKTLARAERAEEMSGR